MPYRHIPVLADEALHGLNCRPGGIYVDGTLGGSGHARQIIEQILPHGLFIGIDQDKDAIDNAKEVLKPYSDRVNLFRENFISLPGILSQLEIPAVDGILLDLGLSFHQLRQSGRGFSFEGEEPLDMRMDTQVDQTAADLVNTLQEADLEHILKTLGEERWAKRIAKAIVRNRRDDEIKTTRQLAQIVCSAIPKGKKKKERIHPATRSFMALRIAVNGELERLRYFLEDVVTKNDASILKPEGRLCIISFHSLEDRIVKQRFRALEAGCVCPARIPKCVCDQRPLMKTLTRKPIGPTPEEVGRNPLSRSAKLRVSEKIPYEKKRP